MWHECNLKHDGNYRCSQGDFAGNLTEAIDHVIANQIQVKPLELPVFEVRIPMYLPLGIQN